MDTKKFTEIQNGLSKLKKQNHAENIRDLLPSNRILSIMEPYSWFFSETKRLLMEPNFASWSYNPLVPLFEIREQAAKICENTDENTEPYDILGKISKKVYQHVMAGNSILTTMPTDMDIDKLASTAADHAECYLLTCFAMNHEETMDMIEHYLENLEDTDAHEMKTSSTDELTGKTKDEQLWFFLDDSIPHDGKPAMLLFQDDARLDDDGIIQGVIEMTSGTTDFIYFQCETPDDLDRHDLGYMAPYLDILKECYRPYSWHISVTKRSREQNKILKTILAEKGGFLLEKETDDPDIPHIAVEAVICIGTSVDKHVNCFLYPASASNKMGLENSF